MKYKVGDMLDSDYLINEYKIAAVNKRSYVVVTRIRGSNSPFSKNFTFDHETVENSHLELIETTLQKIAKLEI